MYAAKCPVRSNRSTTPAGNPMAHLRHFQLHTSWVCRFVFAQSTQFNLQFRLCVKGGMLRICGLKNQSRGEAGESERSHPAALHATDSNQKLASFNNMTRCFKQRQRGNLFVQHQVGKEDEVANPTPKDRRHLRRRAYSSRHLSFRLFSFDIFELFASSRVCR